MRDRASSALSTARTGGAFIGLVAIPVLMFALLSASVAAEADIVFEVDSPSDRGVEPGEYDCLDTDDPDVECTLPAAFEQIDEAQDTPLDSVEIVVALDTPAEISLGVNTDTLETGTSGSLTIRGESPDGERQVIEASGVGARIIEATDASRVTLEGLELTGGIADEGGGGALLAGGQVEIIDTALVDNFAERGGAVWTAEADVSIAGSELRDNRADESGGAVWLEHGDIDINDDSVLEGNHAAEHGGAIHLVGGTATITNSELTANTTDDEHPITGEEAKGGAVHAEEGVDQGGNPVLGEVVLTGSELSDNRSEVGGALHADGVTVEDGSRLEDNQATEDGGAITAGATDVTVEDSILAGNTAEKLGGAIRITLGAEGEVAITRSTLTGNAAGGSGGALSGGSARLTVSTSTISGNAAATGSGGGIFLATDPSDPDGAAELVAVTLYDNLAGGGGDQISTARAETTVERSVLWGASDDACRTTGSATIVSAGHNLTGDATCDLDDVTDIVGEAPLLSALGEHGGHTPVHLPTEDSPLVGAGGDGCEGETDQRGVERPQGEACDIGAVERQPDEAAAERLAGDDRVETAAAIARGTFPDGADTAVLATGDDPADSLGAAPLASAVDGPLLLNRGAGLRSEVADALDDLDIDDVVVIGGPAAIPDEVVAELAAEGWSVDRVFGDDRFATAAEVADEIADRVGPRDHALVAASDPGDPDVGWPDALAAGSYAGVNDLPILLTASETLPDATADVVDDLDTVEIVGGPAVVSAAVQAQIGGLAADVNRLSGDDRWETAVAVADAALGAGAGADPTWVATGWNWPDGLSAGAAAAAEGGVLVLVDGDDLDGSAPTRDWIADQAPSHVRIAGGPVAVSDSVLAALEGLME